MKEGGGNRTQGKYTEPFLLEISSNSCMKSKERKKALKRRRIEFDRHENVYGNFNLFQPKKLFNDKMFLFV
jgi:hypothetical protein